VLAAASWWIVCERGGPSLSWRARRRCRRSDRGCGGSFQRWAASAASLVGELAACFSVRWGLWVRETPVLGDLVPISVSESTLHLRQCLHLSVSPHRPASRQTRACARRTGGPGAPLAAPAAGARAPALALRAAHGRDDRERRPLAPQVRPRVARARPPARAVADTGGSTSWRLSKGPCTTIRACPAKS
jgi:hypothetical protein